MGAHKHNTVPELREFVPPVTLKSLAYAALFAGMLTFSAGLLFGRGDRVWPAFLIGFFYFTSLSLGGLFFAAIQHVSRAGWSVTVRRLAEAFTSFLPWAAIAGVIVLIGGPKLYLWLNSEVVSTDHLINAKQAYLNRAFWSVRWVVFFGLWLLFARIMVGRSTEQDSSGNHALTLKNVGTSVAFLLVFALSYSLFSVDALMSLDPHWFSTIWGIYCFSGLIQSTFAFMIIVAVALMKSGYLTGFVNENHLHDLAKFLKGFTVFYAYIGFSQFMLIWYANLPEETEFYLHRMHGGWLPITVSLALFKFIVPFLALLPRAAKRSSIHIVTVSVLILVMQYVDLYWMIYPNFNEGQLVFSFWEIFIFLGFLGLFVLSLLRFFSQNKLVPMKDPRLQEALAHEVVY